MAKEILGNHYNATETKTDKNTSSLSIVTPEDINPFLNDISIPEDDTDYNENGDFELALKNTYVHSLANTYLTLQAKHFLTDSALQTLIDGISDIYDISQKNVCSFLKAKKISPDVIKVVKNQNLFDHAHNSANGVLRSPYIRKKFYKKEFNYVEPVEVLLEKSGKKKVFFMYIPILETIKVLMANTNFYDQWKTIRTCQKNVYTDFFDGECYRNSTFFKDNPSAFQIILYQDAFEICNPLGSSRKIHKIVGIYMTIANVPSYNRSKTDHIQLVALCYESSIKKFGFDKVMDIIIRDINILELEGILIKDEIIKGTVVAVCGDNLGSHQIGGFVENFSTSSHMCRYCEISKKLMSVQNSYTDPISLRTQHSYEIDVAIAATSGEPSKGVKFDSVLNKCMFFHVCNPGLPPCLAHDVYEGVLQCDFMLCLNNLIAKKYFTYDYFNDKIQKIRFISESKYENIPTIKKSEKLPGNASENCRILQIFPFALHELSFEDEPAWEMLLKLREINLLLMAPKLSVIHIAHLRLMIYDYIELRTTLFSNTPLRPKHHYLKHYPFLIKKFGPLKHLWTLRFESKHLYFKNVLKHSPNFKNVLHTLSERHQLLQSQIMTHGYGTVFTNKATSDDAVPYVSEDFELVVAACISNSSPLPLNQKLLVSQRVTFRGITFSKNMYVCIAKTEDDDFVLCRIKHIIVNEFYTNLLFVGNEVKITRNKALGLFEETEKVNNNVITGCNFGDLLSHEPLFVYLSSSNKLLFSFKSAPFEYSD
ncbi:uncharacterized protein LOC116160105 [Photinus pyralis]|uniref:uncharacterized protein LOC116160105 n=1 Tax=Photinus pyralis TaxID=7054 RepID=UPI0012674A01|nr:uncharacterized protein LOC116160105 [Photinus pyralis]